MKKWSDIPDDLFGEVMERPSEYKKEFLRQIGVDINNIHPSMFQMIEYLDEKDIVLNSDSPSYQFLCIDQISGTTHPDYRNISLIHVFKRLKRGERHCEDIVRQKSLPPFKHLRRALKQKGVCTSKIISINGKYYINEGNHRITMLKICFLTEMKNARSPKKRDEIVAKYTFEFPVYEARMKDIIELSN